MTNNTNPLSQFYRQEKLFVPLPSGGNFYDSEIVSLDSNGEVGVRPMTAADEVMFKDPDALLNGEAIKRVIISCVPAVKNPELLMSADVDTLIVAIRHVSFGETLDLQTNCPKCGTQQDLQLNIGETLNSFEKLEPEYVVELAGGLKAYVRPYNLQESLISTKTTFEQTNIIKNIDNPSFTEEQKLKKISEGIGTLSKLNFKMIADAITKIVLPDGETEVTDKKHLHEFISNIGRDQADRIKTKLDQINSVGIRTEFNAVCINDDCKHEFAVPIDFNPATFFTDSLQDQSPKT